MSEWARVSFHFLLLQGGSRALQPFKSCQSAQRGIKTIDLQFHDGDNEAGGAAGAGAWSRPLKHTKASPGENVVKEIAYDIATDIAPFQYRM